MNSRYEFVGASYRYISATRRDGTGELRIHSGCTTGFTEDEARRFGVGSDEARPATTQGTRSRKAHSIVCQSISHGVLGSAPRRFGFEHRQGLHMPRSLTCQIRLPMSPLTRQT